LKFLTKSKGFTLIEMLISLVILAISLLALAGLMSITTRNNSFGGHITEAATFAQDKLEEFRALRPQQGTSASTPSCRRYSRGSRVRPKDRSDRN